MDDKISLITDKIDPQVAGDIAIVPAMGGVSLADIREVMEIAKLMAVSGAGIPEHLRGQQGMCFAVCMHALNWRFEPFSLANATYVVNDRLAFMSSAIHAVIEARAPVRGGLQHDFIGDGKDLQCKTWAVRQDTGEVIEWTSPRIGDIKIKNSPEWSNNPPKQLYYHTRRDFCRVYFPHILLGVYTADELQDSQPFQAPEPPSDSFLERLKQKNRAENGPEPAEHHEPAAATATHPPKRRRKVRSSEAYKEGWEKRRANAAKRTAEPEESEFQEAHIEAAAEKPDPRRGDMAAAEAQDEPPEEEGPMLALEPDPAPAPAPAPARRSSQPTTQGEYIDYARRCIRGYGTEQLLQWFNSPSEKARRQACQVSGLARDGLLVEINEKIRLKPTP